MKANEFVKKHGIPLAEMIINDSPSWAKSYFLGVEEYEGSDFSQSYEDCISLNCLKRLVESHELVESYGGLDGAKRFIERDQEAEIDDYVTEKIKKAIADVESCMEVASGSN
ncbi:hypothetical protein [Acinetobacter variabilis]|uniref:Uncharacterized protein n=1 Tax=Acinetobacter variabilis TaxID=70346 RepID=N9NQ33_9GAMM|nr:hypothetical protein [Acinetobacter variabilis]ENX07681.1 hypothetical protein F897_02718 [Acinetobacter variabilis]UBI31638.1 hypothetical protein LA331_05655 [Acinetobacter variabilis]